MNYEDFKILNDKSYGPIERISKFYEAKIDKLNKIGTKYGCLVGNLSEEIGGVYPQIAEEATKFHEDVEKYIYDDLFEAKGKGEISNDFDEKILAGFIVSAWQGSLLRAKVSEDMKFMEDFYKIITEGLLK